MEKSPIFRKCVLLLARLELEKQKLFYDLKTVGISIDRNEQDISRLLFDCYDLEATESFVTAYCKEVNKMISSMNYQNEKGLMRGL